MGGYKGILVSVVDMLDDLIKNGRTPFESGRELGHAIRDRAIEIANPSDKSLDRVAADIGKFVSGYSARLRVKYPSMSETAWAPTYLKEVRAFRVQFESVCRLSADVLAAEPDLKAAPKGDIRVAIRTVYDDSQAKGGKPPNIGELSAPVQNLLKKDGYYASVRHIKDIGEEQEFKRRRRRPGKTLRSELAARKS
jgi:hypothetical protein